jgi:NDP-sugar pyrophosphorylase family protein
MGYDRGSDMKALLLVGGKGTRLRPLTIHTPKSIVPIFGRPFLTYQIELLRQIPEIDEVILSLNYQPRRIEEMFGDGHALGIKLRYVIEPTPLGTAGAVRYAGESLTDSVVVFNGDVLAQIDLAAVLARHQQRRAQATIVLTPVDNPSAYGLVESDAEGNVRRFLEKPRPEEITCDTINAGIYILEPSTFDRIPTDTPWSIERSFFPSLIERGEAFVSYTSRGYWIDIGTPEKYVKVHRDIMNGDYVASPFADARTTTLIEPGARIEPGAEIVGPVYVDDGAVIKAGARIGPYSVIGRHCQIEAGARIDGSILWANTRVEERAQVRESVLGRACFVGHDAVLDGCTLGDKSAITEFSRL